MINEYFYELADQAVVSAVSKGITNVTSEWIYSQWFHESAGFTSDLAIANHNLGGLTQEEPNDTPQPDGAYYYINFDSFEDYADYFGRYLRYFKDSGVDYATTLEEYIVALKNSPSGEYFGDDLDDYLSDCQRIYNENFGGAL